MRRRIAPAILISACLALGILAFLKMQAGAPGRPAILFDSADDSQFNTPASAAVRDESIETIQNQLAAFRKNNFSQAASYQVHNFVGMMYFHRMLSHPPPEMLHSKKIAFGHAMTDSAQQEVLFPVAITGADGVTVHAQCLLGRDDDGVFRIYRWHSPQMSLDDTGPFGPN